MTNPVFPKLTVYLTLDGQEAFAKGSYLYNWHFSVFVGEPSDYNTVNPTNILIADGIEVTVPKVPTCIANVLAHLAEKEAEIQAEACRGTLVIKRRRDDLLMLGHESPKEI